MMLRRPRSAWIRPRRAPLQVLILLACLTAMSGCAPIEWKEPQELKSPSAWQAKQVKFKLTTRQGAQEKKPNVAENGIGTREEKADVRRRSQPNEKAIDGQASINHSFNGMGRKENQARQQTQALDKKLPADLTGGALVGMQAADAPRRSPPAAVRGLYVTWNTARSPRLDRLMETLRTTELNAMVIDVNSGVSLVTMPPGRTAPSRSRSAEEMRRLVKRLKKNRVYLIARVVTFKNPQLARSMPAWAMKRRDGSVWTDPKGVAWIDPYRREAWEYPIALAEEAARIGFDEVQFDYVRFPENPTRVQREVSFRNPGGWTRAEAIGRFLHEAVPKIHRAGALVSADVFGLVTSARDDMGIGQLWRTISSEVDVISPMVYPSHYSPGIWGVDQPDLSPGAIVGRSLRDATLRNAKLKAAGKHTAQVRPWLQSFTATWVHPHQTYGPAQIQEQAKAASRAGASGYLLWNSSNRYPAG